MSALGMAVSPVFTRGLASTDLAVRFPKSASQSLIWLPFDAGTYAAGPPQTYTAVTDQGEDGHNVSFSPAANQPLYGDTGAGERHIGVFDGSNDYGEIAAGSGWPAHTSHSVFALLNREAIAANKTLFDAQTGRLILLTSRAFDANLVSYYDGAYRNIALTDTGWMILEWHLDADATSCTIVKTSATSSTTLGSAAYAPKALGGTVALGSSYTGSDNINTQLGSFVIISRATGHAAGVTSAAEREAVRRNLRAYAAAEGITL